MLLLIAGDRFIFYCTTQYIELDIECKFVQIKRYFKDFVTIVHEDSKLFRKIYNCFRKIYNCLWRFIMPRKNYNRSWRFIIVHRGSWSFIIVHWISERFKVSKLVRSQPSTQNHFLPLLNLILITSAIYDFSH